jgi:hypothetical protein
MPALSSPIPEPAPLRVLPFHGDAFDWRRFETFCLDVVRALSDVRHAEVYGVPGGSQRGIDIVATLDDGRRRTIQCRHRKRFTKGDADKVVEETTYDAEEHEVWVTTRVGAAAAGVLDEHDGWSYQSDEGISQLVRSLPTEMARKIVDHAFGRAVRSAFLGGGMIAFDGPEAYFAPFDQPGRLIRMTYGWWAAATNWRRCGRRWTGRDSGWSSRRVAAASARPVCCARSRASWRPVAFGCCSRDPASSCRPRRWTSCHWSRWWWSWTTRIVLTSGSRRCWPRRPGGQI